MRMSKINLDFVVVPFCEAISICLSRSIFPLCLSFLKPFLLTIHSLSHGIVAVQLFRKGEN